MFSIHRVAAIAFVLFARFAVLSAGTGTAGEWPPAGDTTINDIVIENVVYTLLDDDKDNLDSLAINAGAGSPAGLIIGNDWDEANLTVDILTMNGGGSGTITAIPGGNFNGHAVIFINDNKELTVDELTMDGSSFIGVGYDDAGNTGFGDLTVGSLNLSGANSQVWVSSNGELLADHAAVSNGRLLVDGVMDGDGDGTFAMTGGLVQIGAGGEIFDYYDIGLSGTGKLQIDATGMLTGAAGGSFNSSGTVTVAGTMNGFDKVNVYTGGFTVAAGGFVTGGGAGSTFLSHGSVTVDGTINDFDGGVEVAEGDFIVSAAGAVRSAISQRGGNLVIDDGLADAGISASGGVLSLNAGAEINSGLNVSGAAAVQVNGAADADSLVMTGGSMNLNAGGTLAVGTAGTLGGTWNMRGGEVTLGSPATFSGGTINVQNGGGTIRMANANSQFNITSGLNVSDNLAIDMVGGGTFTIGGRLAIDYGENGAMPPLITVTGATTLANGGVRLALDADAHTAFNTAGSDGLLVLATDADAFTGGTAGDPIVSSSNAARYTYTFKEETSGGGNYGLYVTGIDLFSRSKRAANLVNSWNRHPRVNGNAGTLFNDSFVNAVIDGYMLAGDFVDDHGVLDDPSADLNARTLYGIMDRENSGTGYDALMLYNGSGLTVANDATLNLNRQFLRRVSDRSGIIRREVIVDELDQPSSVNEAEDPDVRLYGDPAATRLWAEGLYYADSAGGGGGFAGYDYDGRGIMLGADKRENDIWYGAALAYVGGTFTDKAAVSGDGDIDAYAALVHAGWQDAGGLYVTGTLGYSYADNALRDSRRLNGTIGMNEADFGTHSFMIEAEAGRDFPLGDKLIVTPSAGLAYVTSRGGAHEQWFTGSGGVGALTLDAETVTVSSFSIPLGLAASMDVYGDEDSLLSITGKAGYAYELQNKGARGEFSYGGLQGVIDPVRAAGRAPGRHSWNLGLSARYLYDNMEFGLGYEYFGRDTSTSHAFTLSAGVNF